MCPICGMKKFTPVVGSPYHQCNDCQVWYQSPFPEKRFESEKELPGDQMSDADKGVNQRLAEHLFGNVMMAQTGRVLDCGAKYSWIGKCFKDLGCDVTAIDGIPEVVRYSEELGIKGVQYNIDEECDVVQALGNFDFILLIHVLEHIYTPLEVMKKLRNLLKVGDKMFVRSPDHEVEGYERDLTPHHFTIHPFYYHLESVERLLKVTETFKILHTYEMKGAGQRDYIWEAI